MGTFIKTVSGIFIFWLVVAASAQAQDANAILRRVDDIRAPGSNFKFTVQVSAGGVSQMMDVTVKDSIKGLVKYTQPAKMQGRSLLFVGENMWIFVPGTSRVLRITPQQRILGGVSSADVARTVYSVDYKVTNITPASGGTVLQLAPKGKGAAYGRIDLTIDARGAPKLADFYAGSGRKPVKTMTFEGYSTILGEQRPTRLVVVDHIEGDARTVMTYSGFQKADTPDAWYQPDYLSRQ